MSCSITSGAPYYLYCTVEAKPGYVFRSGNRNVLKYANEEGSPKMGGGHLERQLTGHGQHQRRRVL